MSDEQRADVLPGGDATEVPVVPTREDAPIKRILYGFQDSYELLRALRLIDPKAQGTDFDEDLKRVGEGIHTISFLRRTGVHLMPLRDGRIGVFELEKGADLDERMPSVKKDAPVRVIRPLLTHPVEFDPTGTLTFEGMATQRDKTQGEWSKPEISKLDVSPDRVTLWVAGRAVIDNPVPPEKGE